MLKNRAGATHNPEERSFQTPGEQVAQRSARDREETDRDKKRSVLGWFPALSPQEDWLSWELGKPRLLWRAEIHAGLLCQDRAKNKASCCQPCHCMQPWQEVGLLSNLDMGQVSNKHVLSMSCAHKEHAHPHGQINSPQLTLITKVLSATQTSSISDEIRSITAVASVSYKQLGTRRSKPSLSSTSELQRDWGKAT